MATAWRIEQADRKYDSKPSPQRFDDAILTEYLATPEMEEAERREAALWVADFFATSHGCDADPDARVACTKPEHAGDVEQVREWLAALGLTEDTPEPVAEVEDEPVAKRRKRPILSTEWPPRAECRGEDPVLFFGPDGERQPERDIREAAAKQVCSWCRVRVDCLTYALDSSQKAGIWGGLDTEERELELRRRSRRALSASRRAVA